MDPDYVVFELSSDDEQVAYGNNKDAPICCDDVIFVGEVVGIPKVKISKVVVKEGLTYDFDGGGGDDDDDCVVLDGDPDKLMQVENDTVAGDSEELFVVGEKGQVACRDYPHARHLCAKYPFTLTPHEIHCNQCHCYVCDSLAPCLYWGTGHCDATETLEFWKNQRSYSKNCHQTAKPAPESPTFAELLEPIQFNQVPVSTPLQANYASHGQVPKAASIRSAHSRGTNVGIPYISSRSKRRAEILIQCKKRTDRLTQRKKRADIFRNRHTGHVSPGNTFRPDLIQQHLRNTGDNVCPRNVRHIVRSPLPMLNEDNTIYGRTYARPWPDIQHNVSNMPWNYVCSQPLVPPQPITSSFFVNAVTSQAQLPSQAHLGGISSREMRFQSIPQVLPQSTDGSSFANAVPSEPQLYGVPNSDSNDSPPFQDAASLDESSYLAGIDHLFGVSTSDCEYDCTLQP